MWNSRIQEGTQSGIIRTSLDEEIVVYGSC